MTSGESSQRNPSGEDPNNLEAILERVSEQARGESHLTVRDVLDSFGSRTFGPLYAALGVITISPIGAIPGAPVVLSLLVAFVTIQRFFGSDSPWLPKRITSRSVSADTWEHAHDKARPWAQRIDRYLRPRLTFLTTSIMDHALSVLVLLLGAALIPIGLVPFANIVPGAAIILVGLGLAARDGVFVLASLALTGASVWLITIALGS